MNIANWLLRTAQLRPETPALLTGERLEADYREFARRAAALASALRQRLGVAPGDRVGIFMKNRTEYLEALYAIWWAGAIAVPINAKLHGREAAWICEDAAARLALVSDDVGSELADVAPGLHCLSTDDAAWAQLRAAAPMPAPHPRAANDIAWLFYTSGTTGRPKGVMLSNANLVAMSLCYPIDVDPVATADCALYAAPMSHGAGMYNFVHVRRGARHVVPPSAGFDPAEILELAPRLDRVSFFAAPTMVRRLVDQAKVHSAAGVGIRSVVYGGGPMYLADIEEAVAALGPRFIQIYGQGESPMCISALSRELVADRGHPQWRKRLGSVGTPQSCVEIRIAGADGNALPIGETGEILVAGPQVMAGYWNNPEASTETLAGGWLRTGDMGRLDGDGFLTLTDRSKDVIISGGSNIYPREVEEALLSHPLVHEASVVGRPHPDWGEEVIAFVVPIAAADLQPVALDRHCLERIARFKRPKCYRFLPELPKNNYGKVVKTALREMLTREGENS